MDQLLHTHMTTGKGSGGGGSPAELFQIPKDDAVKKLHSICQQIWKTAVATGQGQVSFHSNPKEGKKKKRRVMPKIVQATIQSCSFHILARAFS